MRQRTKQSSRPKVPLPICWAFKILKPHSCKNGSVWIKCIHYIYKKLFLRTLMNRINYIIYCLNQDTCKYKGGCSISQFPASHLQIHPPFQAPSVANLETRSPSAILKICLCVGSLAAMWGWRRWHLLHNFVELGNYFCLLQMMENFPSNFYFLCLGVRERHHHRHHSHRILEAALLIWKLSWTYLQCSLFDTG